MSLVEGEGKGWAELLFLLLPPLSPPLPLMALPWMVLPSLWLQLPALAEGSGPKDEPTAGRFGLKKKKLKMKKSQINKKKDQLNGWVS